MGYLSYRWLITTLSVIGIIFLAIGIVMDTNQCVKSPTISPLTRIENEEDRDREREIS